MNRVRQTLCVAIVVAACGGDGGGTTTPSSPTLSITVPGSVAIGGTLAAKATSSAPTSTVTWVSESPSVATVSSDGNITGVSAGEAIIRATLGTATARATVIVPGPFAEIAVGGRHVCGRTVANDLLCWGTDAAGQLGKPAVDERCTLLPDGSVPCSRTPRRGIESPQFIQVTARDGNTCGLTADGEAYCWGDNALGQLGLTSGTCQSGVCSRDPVRVAGGVRFTTLGAGELHFCGLTSTGEIYCWGIDVVSQLGAEAPERCGTYACAPVPIRVGPAMTFRVLSVGGLHTCALDPTGAAFCWGWNGWGQVGNGRTTALESGESVPNRVAGGLTFAIVRAGREHSCALTADGRAYCWGLNSFGQLGDGTTTNSTVPRAVAGSLKFTTIDAGVGHTCGLTENGQAYCWGLNTALPGYGGQLGNGSLDPQLLPTAVHRDLRFTELRTGRAFTCGRTAEGRVYCWGSNFYGQLGIGTNQSHATEPLGVGGVP